MDKRGISRFSIENLWSHSTEKLRRGTLLCSRKILVSTNVRDKRGGEYHNFPSKFFCLTVPKNFVGELISGIENFYASEGYVTIFDFLSKFFCLTVPKNFVGELISGIENFYASEGYATIFDFLSKIFCFTVPKNFVGESFTVALNSGIEKVWIRGGGGEYQDFPSKIFCLTVAKNFPKEPFTVSLIRVSKTVKDKS